MGVQITIIMYIITYLIPTQTIPLIIQTIDKLYKGDKFEYDKELILGMFLIFIFVIIESLLIYYIVEKN